MLLFEVALKLMPLAFLLVLFDIFRDIRVAVDARPRRCFTCRRWRLIGILLLLFLMLFAVMEKLIL